MRPIATIPSPGNIEVHKAPDKLICRMRAELATALAQAAFGYFYAPPADADFIDRTPSEIDAIRATMELGAAR